MFRLTKISDYGFVLLTCIAWNGSAETHTARELARATHLPLPMVSKILKLLTRGGILVSLRGTKGGYSLARPAERITATEIISALEGPISLTECISHSPSSCGVESLCAVRHSWQLINAAVRGSLDGVTLADMVRPKRIQSCFAAMPAADERGTIEHKAATEKSGCAPAGAASS